MTTDSTIPVTQRAYTLRLSGIRNEDTAWRDRLWRTHDSVNQGAKVFGDWLLTLRGGLCHTLANGDPDTQKDKRIILALSWLSVESAAGAPDEFMVPHAEDHKSGERRDWQIIEALRGLLRLRGLQQHDIDEWVSDCGASLQAAIRKDAVWVNRSRAFDAAQERIGLSLTREVVWDLLERFFGSQDAYLAPLTTQDEEGDNSTAADEKSKDLVQKARGWLSNRFGSGAGADFKQIAGEYRGFAVWCKWWNTRPDATPAELQERLAREIGQTDLPDRLASTPGPPNRVQASFQTIVGALKEGNRPHSINLDELAQAAVEQADSKERQVDRKGTRPWANRILEDVQAACGFEFSPANSQQDHISEFSVMLDHAARRISQTHSWVKRAEMERRRFEEDARRIHAVPDPIRFWLDSFCAERSYASGALGAYRIRKRAVTGWAKVVEAWGKPDCATEQDRIAAARASQDDPEIDKPGDIQLFEALAAEDARCVWSVDGRPSAQPLIDYVSANDADDKRQRFKVPAYRHPDPLQHPVFCDFGESRWPIAFAVHRAVARRNEAEHAVSRRREGVAKATRTLGRATAPEAQPTATASLADAQRVLRVAEENLAWLQQAHALTMTLWSGSDLCAQQLRWHSKRLAHDLALGRENESSGAVPVTRADRLGRAAVGADKHSTVTVAGLFDLKEWNGRLQAPRAQLRAIAKVRDDVTIPGPEQTRRIERMLARIRWLVSFSARLHPQGPWVAFAQRLGLRANPQYWPHAEENKKRKGQAKLILCRLPGLRILSVDLGHRYAAACAVWETLTRAQIEHACQTAGHPLPAAESLFMHIKQDGKTTIFRRIGPDFLGDREHPAPWARLDRQFLIKLQGEAAPARKASPREIEHTEALEKELGLASSAERSLRVDDLMSEAVRTARLALQRHGRRARIAFNLTTDKQLAPGGRDESLTGAARVDLLSATLAEWHDLATGERWSDAWAKEQWEAMIISLLRDCPLPAPQEDESPRQRKIRQAAVVELLRPVADQLAGNPSLRMRAHVLWATKWRDEDSQWRKRLRWLRDWILPRRNSAPPSKEVRHVGGLSLTRLATMRALHQVLRAYRMRPEPDELRKNIPAKGDDSLRQFGQSILDTLDRLRDNRVKQLASRITAAALGLAKNLEHPEGDRFAPCHAVVIENLTNYRPEDRRTRRENRQLMNWSSAKVKKYLAEACELGGLHLREVSAAYTSRQDARTGAPGIRCEEVPVVEFLNPGGYWQREFLRAKARLDQGAGVAGAHDCLLRDLFVRWERTTTVERQAARPLRLSRRGGEIFVSTAMNGYVGNGGRVRFPFAQADLNAAANIGLRAVLDPDWTARWWYLPCEAATFLPAEPSVKGSAAVDLRTPLQAPQDGTRTTRRTRRASGERQIVNLWRHPSATGLVSGMWQGTKEYWANVAEHVIIQILRPCAGLHSLSDATVSAGDVPF
jgi:IS605 OrfB family transposase